MGDDVDAPHEYVRQSDGSATLGEFVRQVAVSGYFPQMACWVMYVGPSEPPAVPVAMLTAPWDEPRFLEEAARHRTLDSLADDHGGLSVFFDYRATVPPEVLWQRLLGPGGGQAS